MDKSVENLPGPSATPRQRQERSSSSSSSDSESSSGSSSTAAKRRHKRKKNYKRKNRSSRRKLVEEFRALRKQVIRQNEHSQVTNDDVISLAASSFTADCDQCFELDDKPEQTAFTLSFETKLKEPSVPKAAQSHVQMLSDYQHLDKSDWGDVRYAEAQKLYNFTPGFTDLEINEEMSGYETPRHLTHTDKALAALTMCVFKQKESLETGLRDLLAWAKDCESLDYENLYQKVTTVFSTGDVHRTSSDLLQIICGHRAETIQMRRDSILKHAKDPATKANLRKIPPSMVNLFDAEKFTTAVERAGGVKKCFWPIQKANVTSASQAGSKRSRGPSQGPAPHFKPSQGFSHANYRNHRQAHCAHNIPPPQGGYHHDSGSHYNSVAPNYQNTFRGHSSYSYPRQQTQMRGGRKRTSSPPQNKDNKRRKF